MADKSVLSLPISRYSIEEAAKILGCEPAAILRMAGDGELPVFIYLERLCGVAGRVVSPVSVGDSVGDGVWRIRPDGGDCLTFQNLRYDAELFISCVPEEVANWWSDVWVTLDGFWEVDADSLKDLGRKEGAPVMLSAWSDDCGGRVFVAGNLPYPANDHGLWVMAEDLRRLCPDPCATQPRTETAKRNSSRQPKSNVIDFIGELISLLPNQNEKDRAEDECDLIEVDDNPTKAAITLILKLIGTVPALAGVSKPATIHGVIEIELGHPPAVGRTTLAGWMRNSQKVADNN